MKDESKRFIAAVTIVAALWMLTGCLSRPFKEEDRSLLVTVSDLAPYGVAYGDLKTGEEFKRAIYFDFSREVEYTYDAPENVEGIDPLYLSVTVSFERSVSEARKSHKINIGAFALGSKVGGLQVTEQKDFFNWGDESYFGVLKKDDNIVGNLFVCRKGKKVYNFIIAGLYFSEPDMFAELLLPRLEYLEKYDG